MKKHPKEIIVFLLTLGLGFCVVLAWYLYNSSKIVKVNAPILLNEECERSEGFPGLSQEIPKIKKGSSGYFPVNIFVEKEKEPLINSQPRDAFADNFFGKFLKAANEKSLLNTSDKYSESYRFTMLDSFDHPVIINIERKIDKLELVYKELDGRGGYEPGKIIKQKKIQISEKDWCNFIKLLNNANYWQMPIMIDRIGLDGSFWILESVKDNHYHLVARWSPEQGNFQDIGVYLLELTGFSEKNKYKLY